MLTFSTQTASHGDEDPRFVQTWIFFVMLPLAAIVWQCTANLFLSAIAAICLPCLAIGQGAYGILRYRFSFGDAPLPLSPSHGVVMVPPIKKKDTKQTTTPSSTAKHTTAVPLRKTSSLPVSLGCQCSDHSSKFLCAPVLPVSQDDGGRGCSKRIASASSTSLPDMPPGRPVRLLVVGDSLAIGVGQSRQCVPVLPEVIAKMLSQKLNGRVVYWTCHGAPGASTGWIVRELERGVEYLEQKKGSKSDIDSALPTDVLTPCSDTDDSSSEDSSLDGRPMRPSSAAAKKQQVLWRERLKNHRKRFNPDALGPYDVVVVLTGSNDLKSAFFPFLLKGEDAEFRRQAKARGADYTKELRRLLLTLNKGMRSQLQTIRYSVEAAKETVIEKVEETMDRMVSSPRQNPQPKCHGSTFREKLDARRESEGTMEDSDVDSLHDEKPRHTLPLVVLPGLPARAIPIFRIAPLRWLSVPIVDLMDRHKRRLAKAHPGEVLFVPPASIDDLAEYENCRGPIWEQRMQEKASLQLRDISSRDCRQIEGDLRKYYGKRDKRVPTGKGLLQHSTGWYSRLFQRTPVPGTSLFSVDTIHPTDHGYDAWARVIANAIVDDWENHPHRQPPLY